MKRNVYDIIADFENDKNADNNAWVEDIKVLIDRIRELENVLDEIRNSDDVHWLRD